MMGRLSLPWVQESVSQDAASSNKSGVIRFFIEDV